MKEKRTRWWNGCAVSLTRLCLICLLALLSSCDYVGKSLTSVTDVTVNAAPGNTTTARAVSTTGSSGANTLYLYDTFIDEYAFRTMQNMAYAASGGVMVAAPSDAYVRYDLPLTSALFAQIEVANFQSTNGGKSVLLHLTDTPDAWVGDNHVWQDSSLIEIRQKDTELRLRVGGSGQAEFPTEYVFSDLQYGAAYTIGVDVSPSNAVMYVNGVPVANFAAEAFRPKSALYLYVGGGVGNESCLNLLIQSVAVFF